eukprot:Phypoly_transcript_00898.p1 GENE.Phypoly_transcript_00898~~Phypoly_transcript_00898.p1  ORF type:complete len:1282 (+),score=247.58 Phypoly_transcript_00898:76-3921(+)
MDFNINIKKTETQKQDAGAAEALPSLSFSPVVVSPFQSSKSEQKVTDSIKFHESDGDVQVRTFTEEERLLAFELSLRCVVFPLSRNLHALSIMRDGLFPIVKALDIPEQLLPMVLSKVSTPSMTIWHELQQLYSNAGNNPTYRPESFENSRAYLLWMRAEEMEIDNIIDSLKKEPPYQGKLTIGVVEASNLPLTDKGQTCSRPFVQIRMRGSSTVLTTQAVASWAPVWAEDFQIDITDPACDITVELWDKGTGIASDFLIGQAIFPLSTLSNQLPVMGWFPMKPKGAQKNQKPQKQAELHLKLHFTHRIIPPYTNDKGPASVASTVVNLMTQGKDSYKVLLEQITNFENPTWEHDGVVPFSSDMEWLLTEYGKRYRFGKIQRQLEYFSLLVQRGGRWKKPHTENLIECLQLLSDLVVGGEDSHPMKQEVEKFNEIKQELKFKVERTLNKYMYAFPGPEGAEWHRGALRSVIILYRELERIAFSSKLANVAVSAMDFTYNVWKQQYENPGEFSALCDICGALSTQIQLDAENYAAEFKPDVDLVKLSIETYYSLFRGDLESILEEDLHVSTETFSLYTKLNELHVVIDKLQPGFEGMNLAAIFTKYLILWVHEAKRKLETWCAKAIEVDNWEKTSPEQLHSTSVVDIFTSCNSAVRFLVSLDLSLSESIILFAKASCSIFELYTQKMLKSCIQDFTETPEVVGSIERSDPNFDKFMQIKQRLCVRVNNIEIAREYLDDYARELEKYIETQHSEVLDQCVKATLRFLRQKFDELLDMIVGKMNVYMQTCINTLLQNPPPRAESEFLEEEPPEIAEKLRPLFAYVNEQLDLFSECLYHSVFIKILRRVWFVLIKDLELFLFPEIKDNQENVNSEERNSQANIVNFLLDKKLLPFFHANGEGLPLNFLKGQCALLKRELELFNVPTPQLIEIYRSIEEEPVDEEADEAAEGSNQIFRLPHLLAILSTRSSDERTSRFVKAKASILFNQQYAPVLRTDFKLPVEENLVAKYDCLNHVGLAVQLYITTNNICIDSIFSSRKIQFSLKSLVAVKKVQGEKSTEKMEGIKLKTANEAVTLFFAQNRKKALQQIEDQARQIGNSRFSNSNSNLTFDLRKSSESNSSTNSLKSLLLTPTEEPESNPVAVSPVRNAKIEQLAKLKNSFSLPPEEKLKTSYSCNLIGAVPPGTPGDLFITNSGVYFYAKSSGSEVKESFSFSDLKSITKKNTALIFSNALLIKTDNKEFFFGAFSNRDEVYCILEEMWDKFKNQLPPPPPTQDGESKSPVKAK